MSIKSVESENPFWPEPPVNFKDPMNVLYAAMCWVELQKEATPEHNQQEQLSLEKGMEQDRQRRILTAQYMSNQLDVETYREKIDDLGDRLDFEALYRSIDFRRQAFAFEDKCVELLNSDKREMYQRWFNLFCRMFPNLTPYVQTMYGKALEANLHHPGID